MSADKSRRCACARSLVAAPPAVAEGAWAPARAGTARSALSVYVVRLELAPVAPAFEPRSLDAARPQSGKALAACAPS